MTLHEKTFIPKQDEGKLSCQLSSALSMTNPNDNAKRRKSQ